jgi:TPR repeat protein
VKWYRKAAEQGAAKAQNNLGGMYGNGKGVPQDYVQAHKWYDIAGANGYELGTSNRDIAAQRMTPAQIAEAQKLAKEWMEKHP